MTASTIGIDISKDHLDAYRMEDGTSRRFANDKAGHKALIKWLSQTPVERVVFEPTGPYHRAFEQALGGAGGAAVVSGCGGVPLAKVNPRQARRFAEAAGKLGPRPIAVTPPCWPAWAPCLRSRRVLRVPRPWPGSGSFTAPAKR